MKRHSLPALLIVTVLDRVITLHWFHMESNPLVNALGPSLWALFSAVLLVAATGLWFHFQLWHSKLVVFCVTSLTILTAAAVASNLWMVL